MYQLPPAPALWQGPRRRFKWDPKSICEIHRNGDFFSESGGKATVMMLASSAGEREPGFALQGSVRESQG